MKPSGIGGQAVMEGVMMRNKQEYAVAVRKPDGDIEIMKDTHVTMQEKYKICSLPIIRGVFNFADSMMLGTKTLSFSASFFEEEEEKKSSDKLEPLFMGFTVLFACLLAIAIFVVLPFFVADLLNNVITDKIALAVIEGVIRVAIFVLYVVAISCMKDIRRVFMYHGAEHKTINCIEHGDALTVENVRKHSRYHKRCGTSFMLFVMLISIIFFIFIQVETLWLRMVVRILLIPVVAGVSYEFIRLAGKSDSGVMAVLSKPGMWLQGLTTKEPDDDMIEVAIKSVEAVFDWEGFQKDSFGKGKQQRQRMEAIQRRDRYSDVREQYSDVRVIKREEFEAQKAVEQEQTVTPVAETVTEQPKIVKEPVNNVVETNELKLEIFTGDDADDYEEETVAKQEVYKEEPVTEQEVQEKEVIAEQEVLKEEPVTEQQTVKEEAETEQTVVKEEPVVVRRVIERETAAANEAVVFKNRAASDEDDDPILKALDHYFVFDGDEDDL